MKAATLTTQTAEVLSEKPRVSSIDMMRGIVMVIMALDHARDFFHLGGFTYNPTDMATTTPAIFFTRFITHYCAPTFVLLAGTSIFISTQRKSKKELSLFLLSRGLWLILLEITIIRFSFLFNLYYEVTFIQVIGAIGISMVLMAGVIHLSFKAILTIGFIIVFGHNLTDGVQFPQGHWFQPVWTLLHQQGFIDVGNGRGILILYPILAWIGLMLLGYCLGKLYSKGFDEQRRQKLLMRIGLSAIALFVVLRLINIYGDPAPWSTQKNALFTFMSFLNTTKYPPSLLYILMTIGPVLMILSWMERRKFNIQFFNVFGRVPLFYYILHFFILHAISLVLFMNKTGRSLSEVDFHFSKSFGGITPEGGYSLLWVYVGWAAVVLFLYPLCKWYNQYKSTHAHWWLSYL